MADRVDVDIVDWVNSIVVDVAGVFGDELVGAYLHGSPAMGCYYRPKSDLDLLVVWSAPLGAIRRERPARALDSLLQTLPSVCRHTIHSAGHRPWLEQPGPHERLLSDFIAGRNTCHAS